MTILDQIEALNASVRDINQQLGEAQQKLAAYESRKVPLSESDAARIFNAHPVDSDGPSALAVARAALVAAESPSAVDAAHEAVWSNTNRVTTAEVLAAIRAAHDAAIDGGCGAARDGAGPQWLADAAEALGKKGAALNWSQVISEIRELVQERHMWQGNANAHRAEVERAYDERDDLRRQFDETTDLLVARTNERGEYCAEVDDLRRQLDALTRPIDGVDELGRIGWEAWQEAIGEPIDEFVIAADNATAQAIASRVIGALRSAFAARCDDELGGRTEESLSRFDAAVASLKIEPAKVEPKREADDAEQIESRPVVKVGQVWQYGPTGKHVTVEHVGTTEASICSAGKIVLMSDGKPYSPHWRIVSDTPAPKREPFELPSQKASESLSCRSWTETLNADKTAIRDRIREIERRLEAGGL